jgi:hypothetical protein
MSADETAIDALYQVPLDRFTAERNALAASLKKAGDKAGAEAVKALTKPSATAWAINQVWWQHRDRFQALLDAGTRERAAHVARSDGRSADVREAGEVRQRAVQDVTDAALDMLGGRKAVSPDVQYRVAGTVEALASSGMPAGERAGRLTRDVQISGMDALAALAAATAAPRPTLVTREAASAPAEPPKAVVTAAPEPVTAAPRAGDAARRAQAAAGAEAEARARVAAMTAALDVARGATEAAAAEEQRARDSVSAATARRAELETALDEARGAEAAARRELSRASTAVSRAEMDEGRASRDLDRARDALDRLTR